MAKYHTSLLQDHSEFTDFLKLILAHGVKSYLEIGSKHGGSLWRIANALPSGSRVVSVDLPHGDGSFKDSEPNLRACVDDLKGRGYDAHLLIGDSTDLAIVEEVRGLSPFDLCLIDGSHVEPFIRADWKNYGPMAKMVAFHDINWHPNGRETKKPVDVPKVWAELKNANKYQEIIRCPAEYGIGIIWT